MLKRSLNHLHWIAIGLITFVIASAHGAPKAEKTLSRRDSDKVCSILKTYPDGSRSGFYDLSFENVCRPTWKNGSAPWMNQNVQTFIANYATAAQKSTSALLAHAQGYRYGTPEELAKLRRKIESEKLAVSKICCGSDQLCMDAMKKVETRFCKRGESSSKADPCFSPSAVYQNFNGSFKSIGREAYAITKSNSKLLTVADHGSISQLHPAYKGAAPESKQIFPGWLELASYFKNGESVVTTLTIRHELAHACSHIQRQIALRKPEFKLASAMAFVEQLIPDGKECEITTSRKALYAHILPFKNEAPAIVDCLSSIAENENTGLKGACPRSRLEEGYATALSLLASPENSIQKTALDACERLPSIHHPASSNVMQCLLIHSPSFKRKFSNAFACQK